MSVLVVAEKPSVARDIAHVLGARTRGDGYFSGENYIVTWAIGHLVTLAEPHEMVPAWKRWNLHQLPLLPSGDYGIEIGPHAWYLSANIIGRTITQNTVNGGKFNINVEGAGTTAAPTVVTRNTFGQVQSQATFNCGTKPTTPTPSSRSARGRPPQETSPTTPVRNALERARAA